VPDRYLSDEQRLMRETCRRHVDEVVRPFIEANREREWLFDPAQRLPAEILEEADRTGLRGLGVPPKYGGVGLDPATEAQTFSVIATEIARGDSGLADKLVQNWKISVLLRSLAAQHLQDEWFPRYLADLQFLMAHCPTEPRGASDRRLPYNAPDAGMDTRAVHEDGHWTIDGRKQFISNGYDASLYVVCANTDPSVGMLQGTSSFLVPRDTPGLAVTRCNETYRRPVHEQRRDRLRRLPRARGPPAGPRRRAGQGRCLLPARQDHPGGEEPRHRHRRLPGHRGLGPAAGAGRADPDQAPGRRAARRRDGDQVGGGQRVAAAGGPRGR